MAKSICHLISGALANSVSFTDSSQVRREVTYPNTVLDTRRRGLQAAALHPQCPEPGRSPASSPHPHLPAARPGWQCASSSSFLNQGKDRVLYLRSQQQEGARRWTKRTSHAFDHSARGLVPAKKEGSTRTVTTCVCVHRCALLAHYSAWHKAAIWKPEEKAQSREEERWNSTKTRMCSMQLCGLGYVHTAVHAGQNVC